MLKTYKIIGSLISKIAIIALVIVASIFSVSEANSKGWSTFLYFTTQSNLLIALFDLIMIGVLVFNLCCHKKDYSNKWNIIQIIISVATTVTMLIYFLVLVPGFYMDPNHVSKPDFNPFDIHSTLFHLVVPILALIDLCIFGKHEKIDTMDSFYGILPGLAYLAVAVAGYVCYWDFGNGKNYPYPFFNFGSPVGLFGFSGELPYVMGSFYWIVALTILFLLLTWIFILINNLLSKDQNKL